MGNFNKAPKLVGKCGPNRSPKRKRIYSVSHHCKRERVAESNQWLEFAKHRSDFLAFKLFIIMDRISETTELDANSSGDRDVKRQRQGSISGRLR